MILYLLFVFDDDLFFAYKFLFLLSILACYDASVISLIYSLIMLNMKYLIVFIECTFSFCKSFLYVICLNDHLIVKIMFSF